MRYPKAVEEVQGAVTDESSQTDATVLVFVGEDRDGEG